MSALTISDLKYMLEEAIRNGASDDTPVHFSYNYGDHWRTQVAPAASEAELGMVEYSSYHSMDKLVDEEDDECYDDEGNEMESESKGKQVLIIS